MWLQCGLPRSGSLASFVGAYARLLNDDRGSSVGYERPFRRGLLVTKQRRQAQSPKSSRSMIAGGGVCHATSLTIAVSGSWKRETRTFRTSMRSVPFSRLVSGFNGWLIQQIHTTTGRMLATHAHSDTQNMSPAFRRGSPSEKLNHSVQTMERPTTTGQVTLLQKQRQANKRSTRIDKRAKTKPENAY